MKIACGTIGQPYKLFVGLVVLALCCAAAQAQQQQHRAPVSRPAPMAVPHGPPPMAAPHGPPPGQAHGPPSGQPQGGRQPQGAPSGQSVRERWLAMPPDARQNFQRNAQLWNQMSPEQRNLMRQRETMRRQVITREADAAVRDSGLQLNPQERARFESRYIQERRKVEQSLRQQIETERQKEIPALIQQLRKEFQLDEPGKSPAKPAPSQKSGR
jgi:hypothetical protein